MNPRFHIIVGYCSIVCALMCTILMSMAYINGGRIASVGDIVVVNKDKLTALQTKVDFIQREMEKIDEGIKGSYKIHDEYRDFYARVNKILELSEKRK